MPVDDVPLPERANLSNPYAPPSVAAENFTAATGDQAQYLQTRRAFSRERAIKRLSWVNVFLAITWLPAFLGCVGLSALLVLKAIGFGIGGFEFPPRMPTGLAWVGITAFHVACFTLNVALVIGLRGLRPWARWTEALLALVFLILCLVYAGDVIVNHKPWAWLFMTSVPGMVLIAVVLYVLLSKPSNIVFSNEHRAVLAGTRPARR